MVTFRIGDAWENREMCHMDFTEASKPRLRLSLNVSGHIHISVCVIYTYTCVRVCLCIILNVENTGKYKVKIHLISHPEVSIVQEFF